MPHEPAELVRNALWRGCLGGIGMAVSYFIISGLVYLALKQTDLPVNLVLLFSIASGPICGTVGLLGFFYLRAVQAQRSASIQSNENSRMDTD